MQVIQQSLDLRAAREFLHVDSVDDGRFLDCGFVLYKFRLLEVDGQRQMAAWAVGRRAPLLARLDVILDACAAEVVLARRPNCVFRCLVTDTATQDILSPSTVLFEDQIGMIGDLAHLHDETEDVGIVVQQHALCDISLELTSTIRHDAAGKVVLFLAEKFAINVDLLGRKLHGGRVVNLDATEHEAVGEETELLKCFLALADVSILLDWIEQLLVEDRDVLHGVV